MVSRGTRSRWVLGRLFQDVSDRTTYPQHLFCSVQDLMGNTDLSKRVCVSIRSHSTMAVTPRTPRNQTSFNPATSTVGTIDDATQVLKSLVESRSLTIPQEADRVIKQLNDNNINPTFETLFWAIECWSRTKRKGSEERIEDLYHQLWNTFIHDDKTLTTEKKGKVEHAFMQVLKAYQHASNAHRAEDLLLQFADKFRANPMVPPTLEMCKLVLSTWSRSDSSRRATRAEKLVSIMTKDDALPNPDITCYTLVLNCWASSGKENAPRRAELLLRSMEFNEDDTLRPNLLTYTCVLHALARSTDPKAPDEAERLFHEIRDIKKWNADRVVYTAMISVWGRSSRPKSIDKAEEYFQRLKNLEKATQLVPVADNLTTNESSSVDVRVTVVEYTSLIQAWANYVSNNSNESRRAVKRVEELLDELMERYFSRSFDDTEADLSKPNRMTFASVFRTISAARRIPDREEKAKATLRKMHKLSLEPNPHIQALVERCSPRHKKKQWNNATESRHNHTVR